LDRCAIEEDQADVFRNVPVLSATVLGLDLLLHSSVVNLDSVSSLVLSDVGATIQAFRANRMEFELAGERPRRLQECIANLNLREWHRGVSRRTVSRTPAHAVITAVWDHCRSIAEYSMGVARGIAGLTAESAYLVGLLHEIDSLPTVLGWRHGSEAIPPNDSLDAAERWLPDIVPAGIRARRDHGSSTMWGYVLDKAHAWEEAEIGMLQPAGSLGSVTAIS
jgi:hypothetical protein